MKNIIYFLKKYGNQSFHVVPFNEVDSLILCQITYLNLEGIVPEEENGASAVSLCDLLDEKTIERLSVDTLDYQKNKKMLRILKNCGRYEGLRMNYLKNHFNYEKEEQFFSVTFLFEDFIYVGYRGTDITLLGWKEDFNMAILDVVPAQKDAITYLNEVEQKEQKPLYVGGHSKGGNLALYAGMFCEEFVQKKMIRIYNHDGPGFNKKVYQSLEFQKMKPLHFKTTPQQAMIGILLYHEEEITFIKSKGLGILQHDPYHWRVTKDGHFQLVKNPTQMSLAFGKSIQSFLEKTTVEERTHFVDLLFKIFMEKPDSTVLDIKRRPFRYFRGMRTRYRVFTVEERKEFKGILKKYRLIWKTSLKECKKQNKNTSKVNL